MLVSMMVVSQVMVLSQAMVLNHMGKESDPHWRAIYFALWNQLIRTAIFRVVFRLQPLQQGVVGP